MSKIKKNDFISFVNEHLLTLMTGGFKPDLKDMFKHSDIDDHCPDLESAYYEAEETKDLFEAVKNNLVGIKRDFIVHVDIDVSEKRKREILERSTTKKLDCLDIEDILEVLNSSSDAALTFIFGKAA